jgi:hypothetical protein
MLLLFPYQELLFSDTSDALSILMSSSAVRYEESLRLLKGPKVRKLRSFKWQQNFISITHSMKKNNRRRVKSEKEEHYSLSERIKSITGIIKSLTKDVSIYIYI